MSQKLILTTLKNEGAFLLDWVAYNLALGFDHFLIFTNDCSDGTDEMAQRLAELGLATHIPNGDFGERGPQWSALNHNTVKEMPQGDWVFVSDVDEYLTIKTGDGSLKALLDAAPESQAITIPWRFFGSSGLRDFEDVPVRERFQRTSPYPLMYPRQALMAKTLFQKTEAIQKPGVHAPRLKAGHDWQELNWANGDGRVMTVFDPKSPMLVGQNAGIALAQINHYALRSAKSFLVKSARGLANRKAVCIDLTYWMRRNFNGVEDRAINRLDTRTQSERDELMSDPRLVQLHHAACQWHIEEAERVAKTRAGLELLSGILMAADARVIGEEEAVYIYRYHRALRDAELAQ